MNRDELIAQLQSLSGNYQIMVDDGQQICDIESVYVNTEEGNAVIKLS